jgi:restriction endonuclease Mrr
MEVPEVTGLFPVIITPVNDATKLLRLIDFKPHDFVDLAAGFRASPEAREQSEAALRVVVHEVDRELMQFLKKKPAAVLQTSGHLFEKIIAEILASLGFSDITLNVKTEAGEVDIIGFSRDVLGVNIGYIFELKQLAESGRKVELHEITRLYGIREALKARLGIHQAIFVTTTDYTRPAFDFGEVHTLSLSAYENVIQWLEDYRVSDKGLYLR